MTYNLMLLWVASALVAEEAPTAPSQQNIQDTQQQLGEQVGRLGESLEELLEEARTNLGVELQDFDTFRHTRERLADLSTRQMPTICSDLRAPTTKALHSAWRRQKKIAGEINHLLLSVRRHLAPAMSRRVLDTALERQQAALERTRELRTAFPDLEGAPAQSLTDEQQRALDEAVDAQQQAADEMARAQTEIERQSESLAGGDLSAREMLYRARQALAQTDAIKAAAQAVEDLRRNFTRQAEDKQKRVTGALKSADAALAPPGDPATRSEDRLVELQAAVGQQTQALNETSRLEKGHSEADLVRAARDQGEVSRQTMDLLGQQPDLKAIHADSEAAKLKLVEGDLKGARQAQEKALKALQVALREAAKELSRAQQQETRSRSASQELNRIRALLRRQEELLSRTQRVAPERAHALAREQSDLAHTTRTLASAKRPRPLKPPPSAKLIQDLHSMTESAQAEAALCAKQAEQYLTDTKRSFEESGVSEELNPETFYSLQEFVFEAETQAKEAQGAARETAKAAARAKAIFEALKQKSTPEKTQRLSRTLAEAALRTISTACRAAQSDAQRQRARQTESRALQAAAWIQIQGLPNTAASLQVAAQSMSRATAELADQRPAQAAPLQQQAREALEAALHRLTAELGQTDLALVVDVLRDQTAELAETQSRLSTEVATAETAQPLSSQQHKLAEEIDRVRNMPSVPGEASTALDEVSRSMRVASKALGKSQLDKVRKEQRQIDMALARALYAFREAASAAQLSAPYAPPPNVKPLKPNRPNQLPVIQVKQPPPSALGPAWDVALPPRERAEVNQALKEKMPERYRRQITRYYENLARAGLE